MRTDELIGPVQGAKILWAYQPSRPRWGVIRRRWMARLSRIPFPNWKMLVPVSPQKRWIAYFVYLPDGVLTPAHRFTLDRLAAEPASLMVICACPTNHPVPDELRARCDALYWKDMPGYDFSAYALCLSELSRVSPGADVLLMNDSLFGPFTPLEPFVQAAPWRITGFTANTSISTEENHVQSYAIIIKDLQTDVFEATASSMSLSWAYNDIGSVILQQETRLTRMLAKHFDVGAYWCGNADLCLFSPAELIQAGFPFLKRSLLGKFANRFQRLEDMQALLQSNGHPLP